jgi:4-amino-4-deoxy-L-arabinose transferase-like glycosyltransferase
MSETGEGRGLRLQGVLPWLLLGLVWLACLWVRPLLDPDEGRYAEIPREMLASGDWVTPRLDGLKYFEKPPLQYWATAASYRVFGQSEGTARLWTVGLAFLCLPLVYGWARRFAGPQAGLAALVALAVSPLFGIIGHLNMLDAGFTFWLSLTLCAFTLAQDAPVGSSAERRWMLLSWCAAALAVLTKGIVVPVLCGGSLVVYSLLTRELSAWRRLHWVAGGALFLAVTIPWFLLVSARNPGFAGFFFIHEHFTRFLTTEHRRTEPWWFFLAMLVVGVLPWALPLAAAVRAAWRTPAGTSQLRPMKFLLIFAAVTLVFFSLSGSKLPPYILPMLPPLAVIAGVYAAPQPLFLRGCARASAALVALVAVGAAVYCVRKNSDLPQEVLVWLLVALAASLTAVALTWRRAPRELLTGAFATAAAGALAWQALLCAYAFMPPMRSARDLAALTLPYVHPDTQLYSVGQYRETLSPYLKRTLVVVGFTGELELGLSLEPGREDLPEAQFVGRWRSATDAVGFFDPHVWEHYRAQGLPGRVVAADAYTVAVSRS